MNSATESVAIELAMEGLPPACRELFLQVANIGEVTVNELSKLKGVHRTTIRVRLSQLEEAGLVEHIRGDAANGRSPLKFRVRKLENSRRLLDEASAEIFLIDLETQRFRNVSRGARENLGYTEKELLELGPGDVSGEPDLRRFEAVRAQVLKGSGRISYTGVLKRMDGTVYPVEVDVALIHDPEPTAIAVVTDISGKRALEADQSRLAALVESSPESMIVADLAGTIVSWNRGAEVMTGYSAAEAIGKDISSLTPQGLEGENRELTLSIIRDEPVVNHQTKSRRKDGTMIDISLSVFPVRDRSGRVIATASTGTDITSLKEQERVSRRKDDRLRLLFKDAQDPILVFREAEPTRLLDFNSAAAEFFGYEPDEFQKIGYEDLWAPGELGRAPIPFGMLSDIGTSMSQERTARKRDGTAATVEARAKSLDDGLVMIVLRDITAQKDAQEALRQRDAWLTMLLEESPDAVIVTDEAGYISDFNRAALKLLDRSSESLRGTFVRDLYSPESVASVPFGLEQVLAGETLAPERDIVRPDGRVVPVDVRVKRLSDGTRMSVLRDITERRSAEAALRDSQASLTHAQLLAGVGSWVFDVLRQRFEWSGQIDTVFSTAMPENSSVDEFLQLVHEGERERARAAIEGFATTDEPFYGEFRVGRSDGSEETVRVWAEPEPEGRGKRRRIAGAFQNITALRKAEQAKQESHLRLQTMFIANPTATVVIGGQPDETGIVLEANHAFLSLTGYDSSEIIGRIPRGLFISADAFDQLDADVESGVAAMGREVQIVCRDGSERIVIASRAAIEIDGEQCGIWSLVDVTERRELEERVERQRDDLSEAQAVSHVGSWEWNIKSRTAKLSDEIYRIFGFRPGEVDINDGFLNSHWRTHEAERPIQHALRVGANDGGQTSFEHSIVRSDGAVRTLHVRVGVETGDDDKPVRRFGTVQDITERLQLENSLAEAQRMEAIGTLAGGIAHDFNNVLMVVMGSAELIKLEADDDDSTTELADEILDAGNRAAELCRQLLTFSRRQASQLDSDEFNPRDTVSDMTVMLNRIVGGSVKISTDISDEVPAIEMNQSQFEQVLTNLVVNARDALPDGGDIAIELSSVELEVETRINSWALVPGTYVRLLVKDTGTGMTEETVARIFEPFFTTKEVGRGTGLGLSTVHGIIAQAGGSIEVESSVGAGTSFLVHLPATI
jgi:two-component system, cell cycle sensor histidine kinase and response regulator CckA